MGRGKHTAQEALSAQPQPTDTCPVALVLGPRGQHLHEVAVARGLVAGEVNARLNPDNRAWFTTLAQLPPKFRSVVWVRRGGYVLVDLSGQLTDKIGGEVAMVLLPAQVKQLRQGGGWPAEYEALRGDIMGRSGGGQLEAAGSGSDGSVDDLLASGNPNRRPAPEVSSDDDDDDEGDGSE
ncbi:hypothetical protein LPJ61_001061 [Coemansia biformis]|uniref:S1-like domain-containing protein n=1 Tax=Coemansia biformis TaxID=1286918 RepID=A0A9W7YAP7_9FUNG|nr:hypothetical protein LPJ61_001061 [Coemansia biformis]